MKTFCLNLPVQGLVFDLDSTLYENPEYARHQVESQIDLLAARWGRNAEELRKEVYRKEEEWARSHGGRRPSLGNLLKEAYGLGIEESVALREEAIRPEHYLAPDPRLREALLQLARAHRLVLLTNNPVSIGRRSLRALGVEDCFEAVVGLDTTLTSKPSREGFLKVLEILDLPPHQLVSVGDRYAVDIEPALTLGMGGILVEGIHDTYTLPQVLQGKGDWG